MLLGFCLISVLGSSTHLGAEEIDQSFVLEHFEGFDGSLHDSTFRAFSTDGEAETVVRQILTYVGLPEAAFEVRGANVSQAVAGLHQGQRFILYNRDFMRELAPKAGRQQWNDWTRLGILAHEIGHHLAGHTVSSDDPANGSLRRRQELEADRFSGFLLRRMGATREEAQTAVRQFAPAPGGETHPPRTTRLAAVSDGWELADDLEESHHQALNIHRLPPEDRLDRPVPVLPPPSYETGSGEYGFTGVGGWTPPPVLYVRGFSFNNPHPALQQFYFLGTNYGEVWAFSRMSGLPTGMVARWGPVIGAPGFGEQIHWNDGSIYLIDAYGRIFLRTFYGQEWIGQARTIP